MKTTTNIKDVLSTWLGVLQLIITGVYQAIEASNGNKINWGVIALSIGVGVVAYLNGKNSDGTSKLPVQLTSKVALIATDTEKVANQIMPVAETLMKDFPGRWTNIAHLFLDYANKPEVKNLVDTLANKPVQPTEVNKTV